MAEEQIDKLTVEVESVGGDDKAIADMRKQLEKLGRVDLSGTIRQLGNLKQALGYLGTVDESVKSMLDNIAKLGLSANRVSPLKKQLDAISQSARQSKEEIAEVIDRAMQLQNANPAAPSGGSAPKREPVTNQKAYGYDQSAIDYIEEYAQKLDKTNAGHKKNAASAKEMGKSATEALNRTDSAANKANKSTSKLAKTFASMLRFRIAATVMQAVIQSAKEGTTALGEFDAEFKETLNTYSAADKALSGGLGLALAPALEAAAPLIEYIADGIGSIGTGISAITAMLKGDETYKQVKSVEQIKKEMEEAEKKALAVRKLISGFDELNIFDQEKEDPDIKYYEDVPLEDNLALKEDLKTLLEFIAAVGTAAGLVGLLKSAFSGKNDTLKEQTKLTKEDAKETAKLGDVVNALVPSVSGLTSLLGLLGGLDVTPTVNPVGVKEGVGVALENIDKFVKVTVPVKWLAVENKNAVVPVSEAVEVVGDYAAITIPAKELDANPAPLLQMVEAAGLKLNEFGMTQVEPVFITANNDGVITAVDRAGEAITDFANSDITIVEIKGNSAPFVGAVDQSQNRTQSFADAFGKTMGDLFDSFGVDWTELMGRFEEESDASGNNILAGLRSTFDSIFSDWGITMDEFSEDTGLTNEEIKQKFVDAFTKIVTDWSTSLGTMNNESGASFNQMNADFTAMLGQIGANMNSTILAATQNGRAKWGEMMNAFISSSNTTGGIIAKGMYSTFDLIEADWGSTLAGMQTAADSAFGSMAADFQSTVDSMVEYYNSQMANLEPPETTETEETPSGGVQLKPAYDWMEGLYVPEESYLGNTSKSNAESEFDQAVQKDSIIDSTVGVIEEIADGIANGLKAIGAIPGGGGVTVGMHANGGIVSSGEFFMARENGIPEYIGSFGHQTGVANNEQIVSGIAGGVDAVLAAYIPQIITAIEENATAVNIGDDQIYRSASRGAARRRQITGQPAFM